MCVLIGTRPIPSPLSHRSQTAAWKSGHKHKCGAAGQGAAAARGAEKSAPGDELVRLATRWTRLAARLTELQDASDWLGVVALEREALVLARELQWADPGATVAIHGILGMGFYGVGEYARACEMLEQSKAMAEALGDRAGVSAACSNLGGCYLNMGDYARAREMHEQSKAMAEALGDRAGVAKAWLGLGNCYHRTGDYARAREMYEQHLATAGALGDRAGVADACSGLGNSYARMGEYARAFEMLEQSKALYEALGHRAGVSRTLGNLGFCYDRTGDYARAREMHEQHKAMAEALGDRAGVARACGNLGLCYESMGEYARAREMHEQNKAMAEEMGDREGVARACGNLGDCHHRTGEYTTALTFYKTQHAIAAELKLGHLQTGAAMKIGLALRLDVQADRPAAGASPALEVGAAVEIHSLQKSPELNGVRGEVVKSQDLGTGRCQVKTVTGRDLALKSVNLRLIGALTSRAAGASCVPDPRSSASAHVEDRVKEAATWLQTALAGGDSRSILHLSHLAFFAGREDEALAHLEDYLCWRVARGRDWCDGCDQKRGEDVPMLTCSGCRVARYCSTDHQKMASKRVASVGNFMTGRHKDICGLLGKWRGARKDGVFPDSLRADLLAFLRQNQ